MDIFTTQLTRVVPVPIKPANLKVKALLKDAATSKLKEDHEHLENHDYYFDNDNDNEKGEQYHADHQENTDDTSIKPEKDKIDKENEKNDVLDKDKHLDLYA